MSQRLLAGAGAGLVAAIMMLVCGFAAVLGAGTASTCRAPAPPGALRFGDAPALDREQTANARTIIATGAELSVPVRAQIIAVAVALQESSLRNVEHGDRAGPDSRGLFQQRSAWGPLRERMDPATAARLFYTGGHGGQPGLLSVPGWADLPLAQAADAVQHSAVPGAYAAHEDEATALVTALTTPPDPADPADRAGPDGALAGARSCRDEGADGLPPAAHTGLPGGYTVPPHTPKAVATAIDWALQQVGTPFHFGGDCTAPRSAVPAHQCDCSSLIQQAYRAGAITLPRSTLGQVSAGTAVQAEDGLRPGDLVFIPGSLGTMAAPRHVGLYIGHGLLVHAPRTGQQVKVVPVSSWAPIAAIRRLVAATS